LSETPHASDMIFLEGSYVIINRLLQHIALQCESKNTASFYDRILHEICNKILSRILHLVKLKS